MYGVYFFYFKLETTNCVLRAAAFLQSVPVRFRARGGGWWRQGDGSRGLHGVIHGQDQPRSPDRHFVFCHGELVIQTFIERTYTTPGAGGRGVLGVDGAGSGRVRADGDVGVHGAHAGIVQDEVRVVVMELTFILASGKRRGGRECFHTKLNQN